MIDYRRCFEVVTIFLVAIFGTIARMIADLVARGDYPPDEPALLHLWRRRMGWAVTGEVAAVLLFVTVAEAIVILRGYSGSSGVLIGATSAVLGYPFLAGLLRRRVERRFGEEEK